MSTETDMVMFTCATKKAALDYIANLPATDRGDEETIIILTQPR